MDIGKAVPPWLKEWATEVAQAFEVLGQVSWEFEYEYAGSMPPQSPEGGPEDLWHITMFPTPVEQNEEGQLVPEASVDVLAVQEMLDEVDGVVLASDGTASVSGTKNKVLVQINLRCFPPDEVEDPEK